MRGVRTITLAGHGQVGWRGHEANHTLALGAAALVATGALAACEPPDPGRTYLLEIDATSGAAAPEAAAGDADVAIDITLTNTSTEGSVIRSANMVVPPIFAIVDAPGDTVAGGPALEYRDLEIAPGDSQTFPIVVSVTSCTPSTPPSFAVDPKITSDYSADGTRFGRDAASDPKVSIAGTCGLAFVDQPAAAEVGTAITSVAADPAGAPVTVEVIDAGGSDRATGVTPTSLDLSGSRAGGPVALGGTTSATTAAGIAAFGPGPTIDQTASDFTLTATSAALPGASATSAAFAVVSDGADCLAGQSCEATASTSSGNRVVSASFGPGSSDVKLLLSIEPLDAPAFECAGYPPDDQSFVSQFDFVGNGDDRLGTMTVTFPAPAGFEDDDDDDWHHHDHHDWHHWWPGWDDEDEGAATDGGRRPHHWFPWDEDEHDDDDHEDEISLADFLVCWAAPYDFATLDGSPTTIQGTKPSTGEPLHVGLLPDCDLGDGYTADPPCVQSVTYDGGSDTISIVVSTDGRDPWRY